MSYFNTRYGCLNLSGTKMWKKPHYLTEQLLEILPCNLISQHAIFYKARWMLASDSLFEYPLVHEFIVQGLFETLFPWILVENNFQLSNVSLRRKDRIKLR